MKTQILDKRYFLSLRFQVKLTDIIISTSLSYQAGLYPGLIKLSVRNSFVEHILYIARLL